MPFEPRFCGGPSAIDPEADQIGQTASRPSGTHALSDLLLRRLGLARRNLKIVAMATKM
jgi:hypothetical protein